MRLRKAQATTDPDASTVHWDHAAAKYFGPDNTDDRSQTIYARANKRGATILFGEALGRLRRPGTPDLGLDLQALCSVVEQRLQRLQQDADPESCTVPELRRLR
mgnify:CR=1 FL=1